MACLILRTADIGRSILSVRIRCDFAGACLGRREITVHFGGRGKDTCSHADAGRIVHVLYRERTAFDCRIQVNTAVRDALNQTFEIGDMLVCDLHILCEHLGDLQRILDRADLHELLGGGCVTVHGQVADLCAGCNLGGHILKGNRHAVLADVELDHAACLVNDARLIERLQLLTRTLGVAVIQLGKRRHEILVHRCIHCQRHAGCKFHRHRHCDDTAHQLFADLGFSSFLHTDSSSLLYVGTPFGEQDSQKNKKTSFVITSLL